MKLIKQFTAIQIDETQNDDTISPTFKFGTKEWHGCSIRTTFATEDAAINHASETNPYAEWLILPKISFDINETD